MKLNRVTLRNWGPYVGEQSLDLSTSAEAPIVLVHGENMRGKTSIMRAIRWALYGEVSGLDNEPIPVDDFANLDVLGEFVKGESEGFTYGATLNFEHRGSEVELARAVHVARNSQTGEMRSTPEVLMMIVGKNPVPEKDIPEFVQRMLHPDISEFFLFDGETLTRFEEHLRSPQRAKFVSASIEMALGVPALRNLAKDVDRLNNEAMQTVTRASKAAKAARGLNDQFTENEDKIERAQKDREDLRSQLKAAKADLSKINTELEKVDAIKEFYFKRQSAEEAVIALKEDLTGLEDELQQKLERYWWLPVALDLQKKSVTSREHVSAAIKIGNDRARIEGSIRGLVKQLSETTCMTCGQTIPEDAFDEIRENKSALEVELSHLPHVGDPAKLAGISDRLARFSAADEAILSVRETEKDLRKTKMKIAQNRSSIDDYTELMSDNDLDIAALEKTRQEAAMYVRDCEEGIEEADDEISALQSKKQDLTKAIGEASPSAQGPRAEFEVWATLKRYLEETIDEFRSDMRESVESAASEIFRRLTTEPDYAGLRIDGNYYLSIVDNQDRVIERRSAGADQIVTMSLIGALARCSVEEGPIVMDTPFGRLDINHRKRILQWVAELNSQAVLFVQSGEFDRDRDLPTLNGRVGREYKLRRLSATSTRIEAVGSNGV